MRYKQSIPVAGIYFSIRFIALMISRLITDNVIFKGSVIMSPYLLVYIGHIPDHGSCPR